MRVVYLDGPLAGRADLGDVPDNSGELDIPASEPDGGVVWYTVTRYRLSIAERSWEICLAHVKPLSQLQGEFLLRVLSPEAREALAPHEPGA